MSTPINLHEYEALAQERSPQMVFNYSAGGANDEVTVAENRRAWGWVRLRPRVLVNVSRIDISTTVARLATDDAGAHRAVWIGRPYLWGLAVNGEEGVRHVLDLLRTEIILAMALVGRPTIKDIDRTLIA